MIKPPLTQTVAEFVAIENVPFYKLARRTYQGVLNGSYKNVPTSRNGFVNMFKSFAEAKRDSLKRIFMDKKNKGYKFTLSFDEWRGGNRRKYLGKSNFCKKTFFKKENFFQTIFCLQVLTCTLILSIGTIWALQESIVNQPRLI